MQWVVYCSGVPHFCEEKHNDCMQQWSKEEENKELGGALFLAYIRVAKLSQKETRCAK